MSLDTFIARVRKHLVRQGINERVGFAAINDFVRALHESFVKANRDQVELLNQVHAALGNPATIRLIVLLQDKSFATRFQFSRPKYTALNYAIKEICAERGIADEQGRNLFSEFLVAFHDERFDEARNEVSLVFLLYWGIRDEAAYHFGGLFTGDAGGEIGVTLEYLDWKLKRFFTLVERWELERKWDEENREQDEEESAPMEQICQPASDGSNVEGMGDILKGIGAAFGVDTSKLISSPPTIVANRLVDVDKEAAQRISKEVVAKVICDLESMGGDCLQSAEDSGLQSVWEEICVQVQGEESFFWDTYLQVIEDLLRGQVDSLSPAERRAIWLSTDTGWDWIYDYQDGTIEEDTPPVFDDEIIEKLQSELLSRAGGFENSRIARYINGDDDYEEEDDDAEEDEAMPVDSVKAKAQQDLDDALADLGDIFGKNIRLSVKDNK